MSEAEKDAQLRGQRLAVVTGLPEWQEVIEVFKKEFDASFLKIMKGNEQEVWEARGAISAIDRILSKVADNIKFGADCRARIWNKINSKK